MLSAAGKPAADFGIIPIQPTNHHVQPRGLLVLIIDFGKARRHHVMRMNFHYMKIAAFIRTISKIGFHADGGCVLLGNVQDILLFLLSL